VEIVEVIYKHWKSGQQLSCVGEIVPKYNNDASDRLIVKTGDAFEDIIKKTIIEVRPYNARTNFPV